VIDTQLRFPALDWLVLEWLTLCRVLGTTHVEVSNGTIPIDNTEKAQTYFLRRIGPSVNVGNVRADDVVALETLRWGLRSDTLLGAL
jgi:phosphosulfolactate synthase (CoM biosynthesis protein A)